MAGALPCHGLNVRVFAKSHVGDGVPDTTVVGHRACEGREGFSEVVGRMPPGEEEDAR